MMASAERGFEFEETVRELEGIVERLDREDIGLDEAIRLFERGIERLGEARRWLDQASGRVEELIATSTGGLEGRPMEGTALAAGEDAGESGDAANSA